MNCVGQQRVNAQNSPHCSMCTSWRAQMRGFRIPCLLYRRASLSIQLQVRRSVCALVGRVNWLVLWWGVWFGRCSCVCAQVDA